MWVRSAFWIGKPKEDRGEDFTNGVNSVLVPGLKTLPGVLGVEALWPRRYEAGAPNICCQITVSFASLADIDVMLASPERTAFRHNVLKVLDMFDGEFSHIDYEVGPA